MRKSGARRSEGDKAVGVVKGHRRVNGRPEGEKVGRQEGRQAMKESGGEKRRKRRSSGRGEM